MKHIFYFRKYVETRINKNTTTLKSLLILSLLGVSFQWQVMGQGSMIWDYEFKSPDNQYHTLNEFQGEELTIIDFWATWCKPCVKAMPELNGLYNAYKDKGVGMIGLSVDSPRNVAKIGPFVRSMGIDYPVLLDLDQKLMGEYNVVAIPTLIVLNDKGEVLYKHTGYQPGDKTILKNKLESLLAQ